MKNANCFNLSYITSHMKAASLVVAVIVIMAVAFAVAVMQQPTSYQNVFTFGGGMSGGAGAVR